MYRLLNFYAKIASAVGLSGTTVTDTFVNISKIHGALIAAYLATKAVLKTENSECTHTHMAYSL
jgi:hypothetical protein